MTSKSDLRRRHLALRNAMTPGDVAELSRQIERRVLADLRIVRQPMVMTYLSKRYEVNTLNLAKKFIERGVQVAVPVMVTAHDARLAWSLIEDLGGLTTGPFGILQPKADACRWIECPSETPVLIPAVAVNLASGHRIGHGSGHFDRYLQGHQGLKAVLVYENQLTEPFRAEAHDVAVDIVVTEARSYTCQTSN